MTLKAELFLNKIIFINVIILYQKKKKTLNHTITQIVMSCYIKDDRYKIITAEKENSVTNINVKKKNNLFL